jgi:hypothetical protein
MRVLVGFNNIILDIPGIRLHTSFDGRFVHKIVLVLLNTEQKPRPLTAREIQKKLTGQKLLTHCSNWLSDFIMQKNGLPTFSNVLPFAVDQTPVFQVIL